MADTEGEGKVRLDGGYLAQALKACGGMVDLKLTNSHSPVLFAVNGYRLVVMPMLTADSQAEAKAESTTETPAPAETETEPTVETELTAVTETPAEKPKARRSRAKEPIAVK